MGMDFESRFREFADSSSSVDKDFTITFTSSGSTGVPKELGMAASRLRKFIGQGPEFINLQWGTCFDPQSFAGAVVALQAWANHGNAVYLSGRSFSDVWEILVAQRIHALSLTPSFLRLMLIHRDEELNSEVIKLNRLTLGGEVVPAKLVSDFRSLWPDCIVRVIYAAAEMGVVFRSRNFDGFYYPDDLVSPWNEFDIHDSELVLKSNETSGAWIETGDLAELDPLTGGIRILGRKARIINIGGQKFSLDSIEKVIESVVGVEIVHCRAIENPVVGYVVGCAWKGTASEDEILTVCRTELPKAAWPRVWEHGDLSLSASGKK